MKFVFLFGDAAVGKMTVGQHLSEITELRLFHNHVTIEPVLEVFGYYDGHIIQRLRSVFFEEFAKSRLAGMIFTFMWDFDAQEDWNTVESIKAQFPKDTEFYYVELVADQNVRLERNRTENRLKHKPSKRNLEASDARLLQDDLHCRCESRPDEIPFDNYLRIDNTHLSPNDAAQLIKSTFQL